MFTAEPTPGQDLPDVRAFLERVGRIAEHPCERLRTFFDPSRSVVVGRAPGRLDVMGGFGDYSGSLVLEMPIEEAAFAAVQLQDKPCLELLSLDVDQPGEAVCFSMEMGDLDPGRDDYYEDLHRRLTEVGDDCWAAYVAGPVLVLMKEEGLRLDGGLRIFIDSQVPIGKGVSSSAAVEVAVMMGVCGIAKLDLPFDRMASLCQVAENRLAGAPCGIMDQVTCTSGRADHLLELKCQPAEIVDQLAIGEKIAFFGIDSGIRHVVSGADYSSVRIGTYMGYRIIAELAGLKVRVGKAGDVVEVDDSYWGGYLSNISPQEYERRFADKLPQRMSGREFLERYGGTTDRVTKVDPERDYAVRRPTEHPIYENERVKVFARLLGEVATEDNLVQLGELMYQAHASYSACGLGCEGTDLIVDLVRQAPKSAGLYGAKISGGGSGGTVAICGRSDARDAVEEVAAEYVRRTGRGGYVFTGSSPGAGRFGWMELGD